MNDTLFFLCSLGSVLDITRQTLLFSLRRYILSVVVHALVWLLVMGMVS